jgi:hypothetical protein
MADVFNALKDVKNHTQWNKLLHKADNFSADYNYQSAVKEFITLDK